MPIEESRLRLVTRREFAIALHSGRIQRQCVCQACGHEHEGHPLGMGAVTAHHPDYSQPLLVEWLCHSCHRDADRRLRVSMPWSWHNRFIAEREAVTARMQARKLARKLAREAHIKAIDRRWRAFKRRQLAKAS